jgi:hypothetical protein
VSDPVEVTEGLYRCWNESGLAALADKVDPGVQLMPDTLAIGDMPLQGIAGWDAWVMRWEKRYDSVHITPDALVALDGEHVLALVSITATPTGAKAPLTWASAHVWTLRDERIAGWQVHMDLDVVRATLAG